MLFRCAAPAPAPRTFSPMHPQEILSFGRPPACLKHSFAGSGKKLGCAAGRRSDCVFKHFRYATLRALIVNTQTRNFSEIHNQEP